MALSIPKTNLGGVTTKLIKPVTTQGNSAALASMGATGSGAQLAQHSITQTAAATSGQQSNWQNPNTYSPTTSLNGAQNANYNDALATNDKMGQQITDITNQQAAQGNRKAAYLASMSGGSGGYFQSGQIASNIAGTQNQEQQLLANEQQRQGIYTAKAGDLGNLAAGAQQYGNTMAGNAYQRGNQLQDQGVQSGTAYVGSVSSQADSRYANLLKTSGHDSAFQNDYNKVKQSLSAAVAAVPPGTDPSKDPKVAALINQLNSFDTSKYNSDGSLKTTGSTTSASDDVYNFNKSKG